MAVFDPADGSIDPRPRCTGHCCRGFSLERSWKDVQFELQKTQDDPEYVSSIPDILLIGKMLIPLGTFRKQELFTCRHLSKEGNCGIYLSRPKMCRDFPGPSPCPYRNCSSHGKQSIVKRAWNWILE